MSRKSEIREMANLVGNSAAHVAVYGEGARTEIEVYMSDAFEIAEKRTWNCREMENFREMALRRASSVMKERIRRGDLSEKESDNVSKAAAEYIDKFVKEELAREA